MAVVTGASSGIGAATARRLAAEPMAMVFGVRDGDEAPVLTGLPELVVAGLRNPDAAALLAATHPGALDPRVRDRIVAESHGNPLALLELPRGLSAGELAFGGGTSPATTPLVHRIEQGFLRRLAPLSRPSRRLLLTAAPEVRATRRHAELAAAGAETDHAAVLAAIAERDAKDSRMVEFLSAAPGVATVDSTALDFDETVDAVVALVHALAD